MISEKDKQILRSLAAKQADYAHSPDMEECVRLWKKHNAFQQERPMMQLELWTFEEDVIPQHMQCEDPFAREIELGLLRSIIPYELYHDDQVVPPYFPVSWKTWFKLFGHDIVPEGGKGGNSSKHLGHHFPTIIHDMEEVPFLPASTWGVDREGTERLFQAADEIFGDILPPKLIMDCLYCVPTQEIVHRMSLEEMYYALVDYPDEFIMLMDRIADDTIAYYRWLEKENLMLPTVNCERLNQASYCYTDELPGWDKLEEGHHFVSKDVWGFMDSQETVSISPEMFEEIIFPCYRKVAAEYGLLSYGCCEPVNRVWDNCLSKLPNLRKVSISPWCDEEFMGDRLRGRKTIFHRKPSPNFLGVSAELDEKALRTHFIKTINAAHGCTLEFSQRDVYTLNGKIENTRRYIEIWRECIDENWKG